MFWYDANLGFPETTLRPEIGSCCASGQKRAILFTYRDMTSDRPESRTTGGYLGILDDRFKRDVNDSSVRSIHQFNSIGRHDREGVRTFWGVREKVIVFSDISGPIFASRSLRQGSIFSQSKREQGNATNDIA